MARSSPRAVPTRYSAYGTSQRGRSSAAEAGIDPALVGLANAATEVIDFAERPPRQVGTIVKDDGDGGNKAAEFLTAQKFI